ncbi:MAG: pitrilysin family protein [Planctomycetota bacterium]|nr:pitrilysin family protein [Planctomycetota bacterium]
MTVRFHNERLDNGLQIIGECDPNAHTTALGFWISTGARDEESSLMGVSHFLEHMMFKGTERRSAEQVNRDFDAIGAVNNAFTSAEMTAYWAHMLPENAFAGLEILADMMRPSLRAEDFEAERQVILEEIAMYEDQPFWVLYEHAMERFYGRHPLAHRVLGTRETVEGMGLEGMRDYFVRRYSSDNTVLAISGSFDFEQVVDRAAELCGSWTPSQPRREHREPERVADRSVVPISGLGQSYLVMLAPAPEARSDDRYAAGLLAHTLGGDETSKLYWSLVETGKAEEAQCSYDPRHACGEFAIWGVCPEDRMGEVEQSILDQIDGLADHLVQDDLERARARTATQAVIASERPLGRLNRIAGNWLRRGTYTTIEEEMSRIDAVTVEDLVECSRRFPMTPLVTARAVNGGSEAG